MATDNSNVVTHDPKPSRADLIELLDKSHNRLLGLVGITQALASGDCEFHPEACAEVAHALDDIAGHMLAVRDGYDQPSATQEGEA